MSSFRVMPVVGGVEAEPGGGDGVGEKLDGCGLVH